MPDNTTKGSTMFSSHTPPPRIHG